MNDNDRYSSCNLNSDKNDNNNDYLQTNIMFHLECLPQSSKPVKFCVIYFKRF